MKYPAHLLKLISVLKRLPGVGNKSAERYAFQLLTWSPEILREMAHIIQEVPTRLRHCSECGCLRGEDACSLCDERRAATQKICVIASPRDAFAIESTQEYRGLYHVLGATLSPLQGMDAEQLLLHKLIERIQRHQITEVVIALDSTIEGDATALYIRQELEPLKIKVTRLAFGLPMGSSLDYVDGGTLARAFSARNIY